MNQVFFIFFFIAALPFSLAAQYPDSSVLNRDSSKILHHTNQDYNYDSLLRHVLEKNDLLQSSGTPSSMAIKFKKDHNKDPFFYLFAGFLLYLALARYFFPRYFSNLFRVFFNTSLRQNQLTDQLIQAKLPSLFLNIFFSISGGLFLYFLLINYHRVNLQSNWRILATCIIVPGLIYLIKFCVLKFTGWITGYVAETNTYIFILFLFNKIIGISLVPVILLLAFADKFIIMPVITIALVIIGLLIIMRFFRSYGLLKAQLKMSAFNFFLYLIGVEILPLLLIYKGIMLILNKNL